MNSKLYVGHLRHRRTKPKAYQFTYGVYYVYLDLDEIDDVARRVWPFSHNRINIMSFFDRDHMGAVALDVGAAARRRVAARGIDPDSVRISLLTNTRILGYAFNPVSFYLVRRKSDDTLALVMAEVHNTHGEEHVYDLDRVGESDVYVSRVTDKVLYVSPFIDMDAQYAFECREGPNGAYDLRIDEYQGDELFFQAQLTVAPRPMTNRNVGLMLARYPFMTLKTIALIHWQGLKLWMRGVKYLPHTPSKEAKP